MAKINTKFAKQMKDADGKPVKVHSSLKAALESTSKDLEMYHWEAHNKIHAGLQQQRAKLQF